MVASVCFVSSLLPTQVKYILLSQEDIRTGSPGRGAEIDNCCGTFLLWDEKKLWDHSRENFKTRTSM